MASRTASTSSTDSLTLRRPDDWHLHVRDGAGLRSVVPHSAAHFGRAIIMPNTQPPVTTVQQVCTTLRASRPDSAGSNIAAPCCTEHRVAWRPTCWAMPQSNRCCFMPAHCRISAGPHCTLPSPSKTCCEGTSSRGIPPRLLYCRQRHTGNASWLQSPRDPASSRS